MFNRESFSAKVNALINERNITQEAVAADIRKQYKIPLHPSTFSKVLNGNKKNVSAELLFALADYFGVSVDYLNGTEKTSAPRTLADILRMLFTLQETSGLNNIGVKESSAGIYAYIPSNEIYDLDYSCVFNPPAEYKKNEAEERYSAAHGKAVLYGFFLRWSEMLERTKKMKDFDSEMFQTLYSAWKEDMIRRAAQYDIYGNPFQRITKENELPIIERLNDNLEKIFDPFDRYAYQDSNYEPMPWSNAKDLFK